MDNANIPDVRPPPVVDAWIIVASYVRKTWIQHVVVYELVTHIQVAFTIIPFALVFLLAKRKNRKQHAL
ncbi:hypothetical protein X943_000819 [Babesia divergens]|uniref:Uncharacterized protein n=1 Tax=Babesia divergens TaxID=32595 RepID=A0AAD9GFH8_BABDI|nr:hypothetical protein X943_000819 [Babesia divergens]